MIPYSILFIIRNFTQWAAIFRAISLLQVLEFIFWIFWEHVSKIGGRGTFSSLPSPITFSGRRIKFGEELLKFIMCFQHSVVIIFLLVQDTPFLIQNYTPRWGWIQLLSQSHFLSILLSMHYILIIWLAILLWLLDQAWI